MSQKIIEVARNVATIQPICTTSFSGLVMCFFCQEVSIPEKALKNELYMLVHKPYCLWIHSRIIARVPDAGSASGHVDLGHQHAISPHGLPDTCQDKFCAVYRVLQDRKDTWVHIQTNTLTHRVLAIDESQYSDDLTNDYADREEMLRQLNEWTESIHREET